MVKLLKKELFLSAAPITYVFLEAAFLTLVPGYPILMSGFFLTLGLFYSFQVMRENNDILYSALLPIAKSDIVKGKYLFCVVLEGIVWVLMVLLTLLRMTFLADSMAYKSNALMAANPFFLACALMLFAGFNGIFLHGFFKTGYKYGKPFFGYLAYMLVLVGIAEAAHHIPGLSALNAFGFEAIGLQLITLLVGLILYIIITVCSYRASVRKFDRIDL